MKNFKLIFDGIMLYGTVLDTMLFLITAEQSIETGFFFYYGLLTLSLIVYCRYSISLRNFYILTFKLFGIKSIKRRK